MKEIVAAANAYIEEHEGELPILIMARNETETRIIRGVFREKHAQSDQQTFVNVMRLAMIAYGYTEYDFIVKPEFNYQAMQMTMHVWAVGTVTPDAVSAEFFTMEEDKLVPYFDEMPIGGFISQLLPSEEERQIKLDDKVLKQVRFFIENSTYVVPHKAEKIEVAEEDAFAELFSQYATV